MIGTLSVEAPEETVTAVFTGWASAVTYSDVTEISWAAPAGSVNVAGVIAKPASAHFVVAVTGSVPPLRTVNDVPGLTPAAGTIRASGSGSETRTSVGLATVPTVTLFGGDHGPTLPQAASARTSNTYSPGGPAKEAEPPSTTHSLPSGSSALVRRRRNLRLATPTPGPGPVPSVLHETTHVENAGGFSGEAVRAPTEGGTSHVVLTGTARTFENEAPSVVQGVETTTW